MQTRATDRLGIEVPIVEAAMGGAAGAELAAAVADAGGLGMLAVWPMSIDRTREEIRRTFALTSRPFAVNLNLEFPQEERLEACLEEGVRHVSFFWRDPAAIIPRAKAAGATVLHTVGSARAAKRLSRGPVRHRLAGTGRSAIRRFVHGALRGFPRPVDARVRGKKSAHRRPRAPSCATPASRRPPG